MDFGSGLGDAVIKSQRPSGRRWPSRCNLGERWASWLVATSIDVSSPDLENAEPFASALPGELYRERDELPPARHHTAFPSAAWPAWH
jgi:hypothetical protein